MLRTAHESRSFLLRYLWTAFVLLLVVGGLVVAAARGGLTPPNMDGATLAGQTTPFLR